MHSATAKRKWSSTCSDAGTGRRGPYALDSSRRVSSFYFSGDRWYETEAKGCSQGGASCALDECAASDKCHVYSVLIVWSVGVYYYLMLKIS